MAESKSEKRQRKDGAGSAGDASPFLCRLELDRRGWTVQQWAAKMGYAAKSRPYLTRFLNYGERIGQRVAARITACLGQSVRGDWYDDGLHQRWDRAGRPPAAWWFAKHTGVQWADVRQLAEDSGSLVVWSPAATLAAARQAAATAPGRTAAATERQAPAAQKPAAIVSMPLSPAAIARARQAQEAQRGARLRLAGRSA